MASKLPNLNELISAGIDPKTGLPIRYQLDSDLKAGFKKLIRIQDEQDFVSRFTWYNLPTDINGRELERFLYYRGQLAFFWLEGKFYFMPYALSGTLDVYGRYNEIKPIPFYHSDAQSKALSNITKKVIYSPDIPTLDRFDNGAVILTDYSKQMSENVIPRQTLQESVIDLESDMFPYVSTKLMMSSGVRAVKVNDPDEAESLQTAADTMKKAAMSQKPLIPVQLKVDSQDIGSSMSGQVDDILKSYQSIDNLRRSMLGYSNTGVMQKSTYMNQGQSAVSYSSSRPQLIDCLESRQHFCDLINITFGLSVWCEPSASLLADGNMDMYDDDSEKDIANINRGGSIDVNNTEQAE